MNFLSCEAVCYLYKPTIRPYIEHSFHVWAGAPKCYLDMLDKLQKRVRRAVDALFAGSLDPLAHRRYSSELAELIPPPHSRGRSTRYLSKLHDFSRSISKCAEFFPRTYGYLNREVIGTLFVFFGFLELYTFQ